MVFMHSVKDISPVTSVYKQYQESDIIRKERECFALTIPCMNTLHNNCCTHCEQRIVS